MDESKPGWLWTAFSPVAGFVFAAILVAVAAVLLYALRLKHDE
jgi:hypothetical protein